MNERFKNRLLGALCAGIVVLLLGAAAIQVYMSPLTVPTLADMQRIQPHGKIGTIRVLGWAAAGDWGEPADFRVVQTNLTTTNAVQQVSIVDSNWMFIHDWHGDVRKFGAIPYRPLYSDVPWGFKTNIAAIGTGDFSAWARMRMPAGFTNPVGLFSIGPKVSNTNTATPFQATFCLRGSKGGVGFLFRGTNGSSGAGSVTADAATVDIAPSGLSSYFGQTVDLVVTRSGTTLKVYINGSDVTGTFTVANAAGLAKSLGGGVPLTVTVGSQENDWYWPSSVRVALWSSALSAGQAADPSGVSGKVVDFTPAITAEPDDAAPKINAAINHASATGGGVVQLPLGALRISSPIQLKLNTFLEGAWSAPYPIIPSGGEAYVPGLSLLVRWFDYRGNTIEAHREDFPETHLSLRNITANPGATRTTSARAGASKLTIVGHLGYVGHDLFLDRVASLEFHHIGFVKPNGHTVYALWPNELTLSHLTAAGGRGVHIRSGADTIIDHCFQDGAMGPVLYYFGNYGDIDNNCFEYNNDPRSGALPYEQAITVDAATDVITSSGTFGHRFQTGDVVRFVTDSGTLPTGLSADTDYYVYRLTDSTFKVSLVYGDDIARSGVIYDTGFVDITSAGSGTFYAGVGPNCGILLRGDNNALTGNRSANNYRDGLRMEDSYQNDISNNRFTQQSRGNSDKSGAGIRLVRSTQNNIGPNSTGDRLQSGFATNGIVGDALSYDNFLFGNTGSGLAGFVPYTLGSNNYFLDGKMAVFRPNGVRSTLLIPAIAGYSNYDEPAATNNAVPIIYDTSARRLMIYRNTTQKDYVPTFPYTGASAFWSVTSDGGLSAVNNGTAIGLLGLDGVFQNPLFYAKSSGNQLVNGARIGLLANGGLTTSSYSNVMSYRELGRVQLGGWFSNVVAGVNPQAATISGYAATDWVTTNQASFVEFGVLTNGATGEATRQVRIKQDGRINLIGAASDPTFNVENGDIYYNTGSGKFRGRASGAWVDLN